jgi:hypothetical protein
MQLHCVSILSWRSVLLIGETGVPGENHRPGLRHWQTLSHNVVSSTPRHESAIHLVSIRVMVFNATFNNGSAIS